MAVPVIMPQLGETVVEGTVSRWLISEGQPVEQDQPLLQITTDKVDTELPAPASGILLKILVAEGETVAKGTVLGVIGETDDGRWTMDSGRETADSSVPSTTDVSRPVALFGSSVPSLPGRKLGFISPVVGRLAGELGVDLSQISGTGMGGRITKQDVLAYAAAPMPRESLPAAESLTPSPPSAESLDLADSATSAALADAAGHRQAHGLE